MHLSVWLLISLGPSDAFDVLVVRLVTLKTLSSTQSTVVTS
jgi:hypothetical protein